MQNYNTSANENMTDEGGNESLPFQYPPKFEKPLRSGNVWIKSLVSLAFYLILGYYIFPSYQILILITIVVIIHELGHFLVMKFYRYKDLGIFFIPLLGAYVSGSKREISQKESSVILLAGPIPGIIIGTIVYVLFRADPSMSFMGMSYWTIAVAFMLLNLINLLPVYPLDGGQLLNRVFLDEESWVSRIFVWLSIAFLIWFALFGSAKPFYPLLLFPVMMILRMFGDSKTKHLEKKVGESDIDMDKSYDALSDKEYWEVRNIIIAEHPAFRDVSTAPPYEYSEKEEKILETIECLMHRHLIQDMGLAGKVFLVFVWIAAFASPWLLGVYQAIGARFGY